MSGNKVDLSKRGLKWFSPRFSLFISSYNLLSLTCSLIDSALLMQHQPHALPDSSMPSVTQAEVLRLALLGPGWVCVNHVLIAEPVPVTRRKRWSDCPGWGHLAPETESELNPTAAVWSIEWRNGKSPQADWSAASKVGWMEAVESEASVVSAHPAVLSPEGMYGERLNASQDQSGWVMKLYKKEQILPTSFSFGNFLKSRH